ncbi:MAG: hypothetical protein ABIN94_04230 [Ferruginibacter sp.]
MRQELPDFEGSPIRPVFITVLCILTFIGSGLSVVNNGYKYVTANATSAAILVAKEKANVDIQKKKDKSEGAQFALKMVNSIASSPSDIKKSSLSGIAGSVLCLCGAFLMWNLRKKGFYLYITGVAVGIIAPFLIFGSNNFVAVISSVAVGFIGLLFIVLYGVNLKFMNK